MEENIGVLYSSSEQHKTVSAARMKRDREDTLKVMEKLDDISPFKPDPTLRNIFNGIVADYNVNVDNLVDVGSALIKKMERQNIFSYTFKRNERVKNMGTATVSSEREDTIDPELLFQLLLNRHLWILTKSSNTNFAHTHRPFSKPRNFSEEQINHI
jgi:hypothetical protein